MINPVEQIVAARRRLRQVAGLRAGLTLALPALTALVLAATLHAIGEATWERAGYALTPARFGSLRAALALAGVVALAGCALMAWRAWREADDFMDAAERVDDAVDGHQENRHARESGRPRRAARATRTAHPVVPAAMAPRRRLPRALRS